MIVLSRIDSRLIHGQVIEAWLPHLEVQRVIIADDEAARDPLARAAMALAVPPNVEVQLRPVGEVDYAALAADRVRTLVLFRDVSGAVHARAHGLPDGLLNVGNVHAGPGREPVSQTVFLSHQERALLQSLGASGMDVVIQAIPNERPQPLA